MQPGNYFDEPAQAPKRLFSRLGIGLLVLAVLALVVGGSLQAPYVIEKPGPVFNVLGNDAKQPVISILDAKTYPTEGALDLLTVSVYGGPNATPSWLEVLGAMLNPAEAVTPLENMFPPNASQTDVAKQSALEMSDSQSQATAAALRALGYRYSYQVYVDSMPKKSASAGLLFAGDLIKTIDGKTITGINGLRAQVAAANGKAVTVSGIRKGKPFSVSIKPMQVSGRYRLGIYAGTKFLFPIKVSLRLNDVGGPSGGTMFALGIYDKLTPGALTGGQLIAGTGTIDESGQVGPIGGIRQKMYGAQRSGATWFLAPAQNCDEVVGNIPTGLQVVKMSTFSDALRAVKQIAAKHSIAGLPQCGK